MVEGQPSADTGTTGEVASPRLPRGVMGALSVIASLWTVGVCLRETPTAVYSFCGTCCGVARASLFGEAVWGIVASVAAAVIARFFSGRFELRVARSAALVALGVWAVSIGFVRGWW
jgi:hypothetical protein